MGLANYTQLQTELTTWLYDRSDLTAAVQSFITLAEADFNRRLRARDQITRLEDTASGRWYTLPTDFQELLQITAVRPGQGGSGYPLKLLSKEDAQQLRYNDVGGAYTGNVPTYFNISLSDRLEFIPSVADDTVIALTYYQRIPSLTVDAPTNWLLTKHPDLYLYSSLMQAAPYLDDDDRIPVWQQLAEKILADINTDAQNSRFGGAMFRRPKTFG
jgi:hypothetical protein